jgi:type II secretory pathway component PulL
MVRSALARRVNLLGGSHPQVVTTVDRWVLLVGLALSAVVLAFLVVTLVRARLSATLTSYALPTKRLR